MAKENGAQASHPKNENQPKSGKTFSKPSVSASQSTIITNPTTMPRTLVESPDFSRTGLFSGFIHRNVGTSYCIPLRLLPFEKKLRGLRNVLVSAAGKVRDDELVGEHLRGALDHGFSGSSRTMQLSSASRRTNDTSG